MSGELVGPLLCRLEVRPDVGVLGTYEPVAAGLPGRAWHFASVVGGFPDEPLDDVWEVWRVRPRLDVPGVVAIVRIAGFRGRPVRNAPITQVAVAERVDPRSAATETFLRHCESPPVTVGTGDARDATPGSSPSEPLATAGTEPHSDTPRTAEKLISSYSVASDATEPISENHSLSESHDGDDPHKLTL